jgi:succinate-semialdehyde dehydrogenase / glutarate-semialdehyde dehydrogenase
MDLLGPNWKGLFINGEWQDAEDGKTFKVLDPANGEPLVVVADGSPSDAVRALDAAVTVQGEWGASAPRLRAELLRKAFEAIMDQAPHFAELISLEMGKTLKEAHGEILYGAEFFRWFSEEAVRIEGRWLKAPAGGGRLLTMYKPVGPCLMITPWNFPLAMATRKLGASIAAGCTTVLKPAELTPLTTLAVTRIFQDIGLPNGVLNVVCTSDAPALSATLMADPRLRKVSFTGSTAVGKILIKQSADQVQRISMELGGNAPFIVFEDADIDAAIEGAMIAKMRNMGEACTAANRFLVHELVAQEFADKLAARMGALKVGRGQDEGVDVGPLIDDRAVNTMDALVADAVANGAQLMCGGVRPEGPGFFYPPTVLLHVAPKAAINSKEIFGPVASITTFQTEEEAVARANETEYGLASYFYTKDHARTIRMAENLAFGMIGANTGLVSNPAAPFGGIKQSGFGREGGFEGIEEYLDVSYLNFPL